MDYKTALQVADFRALLASALFVITLYFVNQRSRHRVFGPVRPQPHWTAERLLPGVIFLVGLCGLAISLSVDQVLGHYLPKPETKPEPFDASQAVYLAVFYGPIAAALVLSVFCPRSVRKPIFSMVLPSYLAMCVFLPITTFVPIKALDYPAISGALFGLATAGSWLGLFQAVLATVPGDGRAVPPPGARPPH